MNFIITKLNDSTHIVLCVFVCVKAAFLPVKRRNKGNNKIKKVIYNCITVGFCFLFFIIIRSPTRERRGSFGHSYFPMKIYFPISKSILVVFFLLTAHYMDIARSQKKSKNKIAMTSGQNKLIHSRSGGYQHNVYREKC